MNDAATKTGAYLCRGCGLGERLDVAALAELASADGAAVVREHEMLCRGDGVRQITDDITGENLTHVVIGACSRRAKTEVFNFAEAGAGNGTGNGTGNGAAGVAVARANLREGVIWTQPDSDDARETTQEMAADYVRMALAEARHMRPPAGSPERAGNRRILVVGGGVSGLTAAAEAAAAGYQVLLVEKTGQLGGWARRWHRWLPAAEPYAAPVANDIGDLIARVEVDDAITVHLNATVTRTSGAPGRFSVDISGADGVVTENIGGIVQASGFRRYDATRLPEFAVGKTPDVVDQIELEALANAAGDGAIKRPSAAWCSPTARSSAWRWATVMVAAAVAAVVATVAAATWRCIFATTFWIRTRWRTLTWWCWRPGRCRIPGSILRPVTVMLVTPIPVTPAVFQAGAVTVLLSVTVPLSVTVMLVTVMLQPATAAPAPWCRSSPSSTSTTARAPTCRT